MFLNIKRMRYNYFIICAVYIKYFNLECADLENRHNNPILCNII